MPISPFLSALGLVEVGRNRAQKGDFQKRSKNTAAVTESTFSETYYERAGTL